MGHQWGQEVRLLLAALALVAWIAWAVCCTQLARAVVEQVRSGHVGTQAGAVLTDRVAARMAAGVLALVAFGAPLTLSTGAGAAKPPRHRDRGTGCAHRRSSPAPGTLHRDRGPGPRSGQLRGAPGGLSVVHRRGTSGRRRRLAGHRCLEPRPHHGRRPPVRRSEHDSRRVDSRDARRGRAAPPRSGCECRTRRTPSRLARPLAGGSPETMAARHLTRRHLPFRRPPGSAFS